MTIEEFKSKYPPKNNESEKLLKKLYDLDNKKSQMTREEINILIKNGEYSDDILDMYTVKEILDLFDEDFIDNNISYMKDLFISLTNKNINDTLQYVLENDKLFNIFFTSVDYYYASFSEVSYELVQKAIRKMIENNKVYSNSFVKVLPVEYQKQLINDDFTNDILVWFISACNKEIQDDFFQHNKKAIQLYSKFNIHSLIINNIKLNANIINDKNFFNLLKSESLVEFRNNIEMVQEVNPSNILNTRVNMYYEEMLNTYNLEEDMFDIYCKFLNDKNIFLEYENNYILSDEIKKKIYYTKDEKLYEFFKIQTSQKISEIVIDGLFYDNYYNVMINIKEMLRYNNCLEDNNDKKTLSKDKIAFYNNILNIDKMSNQEKINLYNKLKDKQIYKQFYFDLRKTKDFSYQKIIDSLINPLDNENLLDKEKTAKYGVKIYNYSDEKYSMIVRCSPPFDENIKDYKRNCYTLITDKDNTVFSNSKFVYGYYNINKDIILHIHESDSYSNNEGSDYINRIMTINQIANIENYNEIQLVNKKKNDVYVPLKPDFIVTFDEVQENQIEESKRLNIPIVILKEKRISFNEAILNELTYDYVDYKYVNMKSSEERSKTRR